MPQVNLLPWREELRKRRNQDFAVATVVFVVLMAGVWFGIHLFYNNQIAFQNTRNQFLEQQIAALNQKIKEIEELDREKERLLARMQIIQELQSSRPHIVHLFDAFVQSLPEGVYYTRIDQKGRKIAVTGVAQSNARVSSLMRSLEDSEWLENAALEQIQADTRRVGAQELRLSNFSLTIQQEEKKKKEGEEEGAS